MATRQNSITNLGTDFAARARDITSCLRDEGYNTRDIIEVRQLDPTKSIVLNLRIDVPQRERGRITNTLVTAITSKSITGSRETYDVEVNGNVIDIPIVGNKKCTFNNTFSRNFLPIFLKLANLFNVTVG